MKRLYPFLFFLGATVLVFWKVIFHRDFTLLNGSDTAAAYYPWFDVAAYWLKRGVFLLWDPYVYSGKFTMGEPQPGIFYPLNWVFMMMPAKGGGMSLDAMQALLIADYLLAGFFFYLLARELGLSKTGSSLAGLAWAYGGYTAQIYGYANVLAGFVWMPLVILFFHRAMESGSAAGRFRALLASGAFLALSFLPGHHVPPIHTGLLLLIYAGYRLIRDWGRTGWRGRVRLPASLAIVAGTGVLLTALHWLPAAQWARQVYRWVGAAYPVTWGESVPYSVLQQTSNLSPQDLVSLVLPGVTTNANLYTGFAVVFLALIGFCFGARPALRFFSAAAFVYLFASWGVFSALHGWLNTFVPGLWFAREVFYYLIPFQACLALLAGGGLDRLAAEFGGAPDRQFRTFLRRAGWVAALLGVAGYASIAALFYVRDIPLAHPYFRQVAAACVQMSIVAVLLFFAHTGRMRGSVLGYLLVGVVLLDLGSNLAKDIQPKQRPADQENYYAGEYWKKPPLAQHLTTLRASEYFRVDDPSNVFPPNFGDVWRLDATMGHGATALVSYFRFRGTGWGPSSNATALLNARYIVSREEIPGMERTLGDREAVYRNPRAVARAFVPRRYRAFRTDEEILRWIPTPLLTPKETVLLSDESVSGIPPEIMQDLVNEDDGIDVRVLSHSRAGDRKARQATDQATRHKLVVFQAAWGWSEGDELTVSLRPGEPSQHCYLVLNYYAMLPGESVLKIRKTKGTTVETFEARLAGLAPGEAAGSPKSCAVDLGSFESLEYRVSLERGPECSANLDSVRVTRRDPTKEEDPGTVRIASRRPNRVRLEAEMQKAGLVVLSEVFYPGWEACVDGKEAPLLRADYVLRVVPVPRGKHEIVLLFRPRIFFAGLGVSIVSLAAVGAVFWLTRPGARNQSALPRKDA